MKKFKKPLLFVLALLPVAVIGGYFTLLYQLDILDPVLLETAIAQVGSMEIVIAVSVMQVVSYAAICGFFGYILARKVGLLKPFGFKRSALVPTVLICIPAGIVFSLDYWTFGAWIPGVQEATAAGVSVNGWIASVLYGGVIEEVMLRLFMMSLIAWLIWKIFLRRQEAAPDAAIIAANIIAAFLFAAGHLPATVSLFGTLTPMILLRCFLLNGGFGLLFGWLYSKYGIQYAMVSHALMHIVSKTIWAVFI